MVPMASPMLASTREVLRLAAPAVLTTFLQALVFLTDRVLLGRHSEDALASMQVQGPLLWSLFGVFSGMVLGTVPLVARAVGAGDLERAGAVARTALALSLALGVLVIAVCWPFTGAIVAAIGPSSAALRALSESYVEVGLFAFPQMFVATSAAMILQASGNTRAPLAAALASNGVNALSSFVLIFGVDLGPLGTIPELGVRGAAIGSVLAFSVEAALMLALLSRGSAGFRLAWRRPGASERRAARDLVRVSSPALAERLVIHGGYVAYAAIISALGPLVMAGNQALITLESICFLSADGFGVAAASLVGRSLGAGDPSAARRSGWVTTALAVVALTTLGALLWVTGRVALEAFVPRGAPSDALVGTAMSAMPLLALSQPFMATAVVLSHALRGAGDTRTPLFVAILGGVAVRLSLAAWLGLGLELGLRAAWIASAADWAFRTLLLAAVFRRGGWARLRL